MKHTIHVAQIPPQAATTEPGRHDAVLVGPIACPVCGRQPDVLREGRRRNPAPLDVASASARVVTAIAELRDARVCLERLVGGG
jgi:hypothetical protein